MNYLDAGCNILWIVIPSAQVPAGTWLGDRMSIVRYSFASAAQYVAQNTDGTLISDSDSGANHFGAVSIVPGLYMTVGLPTKLPWCYIHPITSGLQFTCGNVNGALAPFLNKNYEVPQLLKAMLGAVS